MSDGAHEHEDTEREETDEEEDVNLLEVDGDDSENGRIPVNVAMEESENEYEDAEDQEDSDYIDGEDDGNEPEEEEEEDDDDEDDDDNADDDDDANDYIPYFYEEIIRKPTGCRKLPVPIVPLTGPLAEELNYYTQGKNFRRECKAETCEGVDASTQGIASFKNSKRRSSDSSEDAEDTSIEAPSCSSEADAVSSTSFRILNSTSMLLDREIGAGDVPHFSPSQRNQLCCYRNMPCYPQRVVDNQSARAYVGQFTPDGSLFIAAFQDKRVRVYDVMRNWTLVKDMTTRLTNWTVTDTCLSPDRQYLAYASISQVIHLVSIAGAGCGVRSISNVTDIHEPLNFGRADQEVDYGYSRCGIWSLDWSSNGQEIVAGTNNPAVILYDLQQKRVVANGSGHRDDVNSVTYVDDTPNIIASGSDDSFIKIWDRRLMGMGRSTEAGTLVGHTEGLTHVTARGDGRYLVSNAKDQTAKLWDMRRMRSKKEVRSAESCNVKRFNWDYRGGKYPGDGYEIKHPNDDSLMTYRGHQVRQTLIRVYFSPLETTGQRFIYTGSADGNVYIYDVVTGHLVKRLPYHRSAVRDVSWHPSHPMMATVSWDGHVVQWGPTDVGCKELCPPRRRDWMME